MKTIDMRKSACLVLLLGAWFLVACQPAGEESGTGAPESAGAGLPGPGALTGWEMVSQPESYGPENLWDYINGEAEFYLNYGFVRLDAAEYRAKNGSLSVVVEVYQMAEPEEAFGIFAAERNPDDRSIEIGSGGYLGSNVLNFWQENNYVKLIAFETGASTEDALMEMAGEISTRFPEGSGVPEIFSLFPDEARIEGSERFFPRSFLGQTFLNRAYRVDYSLGSGDSYQLFLAKLDSIEEARDALTRYAEFMESQGRSVELADGESATSLSESGTATVVFVNDELLCGVLDAPSAEHGRIAADALADRLAGLQ